MTLHFVLDFSPEELWPDDLYTIREREDPLLCKQLEKLIPRSLRLQETVEIESRGICSMMTRGHYVQKGTWLSYWNGGAVKTRTVHRSKGRAVVLGRKELESGGE
ncbi:predicted protein [Histoplasma capsulatum G186AR]|uniref:Uncharacterized protein n=1 Tax=Ajellomyces capsulatus (strain G186AR / H82 / ATCC MYA-2454 / RMSCC 2432) TaxID=447093 RepID=C0NNF9_AJECG|nr:uncharacterized protein HCBG_04286 [Histoplasma capsulatum G186AR]EEH07407.1 predicted protein [Histoplasma capsulatum G186AR]